MVCGPMPVHLLILNHNAEKIRTVGDAVRYLEEKGASA